MVIEVSASLEEPVRQHVEDSLTKRARLVQPDIAFVPTAGEEFRKGYETTQERPEGERKNSRDMENAASFCSVVSRFGV